MKRLYNHKSARQLKLNDNGSVDLLGKGLVVLTTAITTNVTTTSTVAGTFGVTTHATGRNSLFVSDGAKFQAVSSALTQAAFVAALTGAGGGAANGSLVDEGTLSTANTYSDAAVNTVLGKIKDNVAELAAKLEAIRAALVASGGMAAS